MDQCRKHHADAQPGDEPRAHRRTHRGEGTFDLVGLVAVLRDLGFDGPWGVEILSTSFRGLPVREVLKLAADSALSVL
jgi:sugar phosphate isomerase/epimerase